MWAARREVGRLALREVTATHRGGVPTRLDTPWSTDSSFIGQRSGERRSYGNMRDRARKAYRDNPIARSLLRAETDNVVAEGFSLQAQTDSDEFNSEAEEKFEKWLDRADILGKLTGSQLQRMFWENSRRDGGMGCILAEPGIDSRLQLIPDDLIQTPDGKWNDAMYDGVEMDAVGRPIAYHILAQDEMGRREFTRIAADDFIHLNHITEPLQVRGESCYATIFGLLDHVEGLTSACVSTARIQAAISLIFKKKNPDQARDALASITNNQGTSQRTIYLEDGSVKYVGTDGEEVEGVKSTQPLPQMPDFMRLMFRMLGQPFNMPLEIAFNDVSQVNFSSARVGLLSFYRATVSRQLHFKQVFLSRVYRWWISRERKRQAIGGIEGAFVSAFPEKFWEHDFMARGWLYTDPVTQAQADLLRIDGGMDSPQNCTLRDGRDWETVQDQLSAAKKKREELGLPEVRSSLTRDPQTDAMEDPNAVDPELERMKAEADAYGVAERAGALTPQTDDEEHFRSKFGLPPMSEDVKKAWKKDEGTRRPITLTPPPGEEPAPVGGRFGNTEGDEQESENGNGQNKE